MRRALAPVVLVIAGVLVAACFPQPTPPTSTTTTTAAPTSTTTVATSADLSITAGADDSAPPFFHVATLTTVVHNDGPDAAVGVTATVTLPAGLTFIDGSSAYDAGSGTWAIGSLADGADATLVISARVGDVALGARTVTAVVGSATSDPDGSDDAAMVNLVPVPATQAVTITADPGNPSPPDVSIPGTMTFTAVLTSAEDPGAPGVAPQFFWGCATASTNPCPPVDPSSATYSLPTQDLVVDSYTVSVDAFTADPNYEPLGAFAFVEFTTVNGGGG